MSLIEIKKQRLSTNKVLTLLIPCLCILGCAQKQSSLKIPALKTSSSKLNRITLRLDTVEKFKPISRNSILTTDSKGKLRIFSIAEGYEVTLNKTKWEIINRFNPFNHGEIKSNIVHSNLIKDSLVYFLYEEVLWKFNIQTHEFVKLEVFRSNIKTKNGTLYHNWQDCYNQTPGIAYCSINNTLYYPVFSYHKKENKFFIGSYNLNNRRLDVLHIERPDIDEMIQRSVQDNTMFNIDSNRIHFAFGFSKLGLVYNISNESLDTINLQSKYDTIPQIAYTEKNTGIKSSGDRLIRTIIYNARYNYFVYNPFKKHYYKIFNKHLDEDNKLTGLKNTLNEKELVLQIYDNSLSLIREIPLPLNFHYVSMMTINEEGLSIFDPTDSNFVKHNPDKIQMLSIHYE